MILLTFTGSNDPFSRSAHEGDARIGPVLTVLSERRFDAVYLFTTPRMAEISELTQQEIRERHPGTRVETLNVPLKDPTNYLGILRQLRAHFRTIQAEHPTGEYAISVSSGTPQMHACWLLLVASGEIPATLLQTTPPEFVSGGASCVKEVDLSKHDFPKVSIRESDQPPEDSFDLAQVCHDLGIVGEDTSFTAALRRAATFAEYDDVHVLLLGETGTGKELFTKLIHFLSRRSRTPLVTLNCSNIPQDLAESHLFGHTKGSFTGAASDHTGKFSAADCGILFLDELGELSLLTQSKLLRALDSGEIEVLGHSKPRTVNVRVVAATNRDLKAMVAEGTFRADLYQRFNATVAIPPLRQRRADIPRLALHILDSWNRTHKRQRSLSSKALATLQSYQWPGNIRELSRVILQSAMLSEKSVLTEKDLVFEEVVSRSPSAPVPEPGIGFNLTSYLEDLKQNIVERALEKADGVQAKAAKMLGWSPQALNQHLKTKKHQ
jgi:transcriptional regulator with GAF, ATPase, and Fis domain